MTYWLCITNEDNWKVIKERNIWGVPERHKNTLGRIPKDWEICYMECTE